MKNESFLHIPVLLEEVLNGLKINPDGTYVDATVGGAGHCVQIAKKLRNGRIFAFDRDPDAILIAKKKLKNYNVLIFNTNFKNMKKILEKKGQKKVDGVLMDLGVSSFQLDNKERGFSYSKEGPLDMRMNRTGLNAKDFINTITKEKLIYILKNYGDEKFYRKIAERIIEEREKNTIETTTQLAKIISSAVPFKFKRCKNPSKKSFQAIRIAINDEIYSLKEGLEEAFSILNPKARLLVISFHSIEDRVVKNFYKKKAIGCICPQDLPFCVCEKKPKAKIVNRKPIIPSEYEIKKNKRSHSAKLRILEKIWILKEFEKPWQDQIWRIKQI